MRVRRLRARLGCSRSLACMSTKTLRWLGILFPVLFWASVIALRTYLAPYTTAVLEATIEVLLVAGAGALFSNWVATRFERHDAEIDQRVQQTEALRQAALALTAEVDLSQVLQRVVDLSRQLSQARYAALGVLDADGGHIEQFITSGVTPEERGTMGDPPQGHGLLGAILTERRPMRVDVIQNDPRSAGFPANHPPMKTLLGVSLISKGQILGNLYLTDKFDSTGSGPLPFTEQDQNVVEMFAAHASVAIENARLYQQNQQIAIMQERERFGMNLHDGVIQSIYAMGLLLDDAHHRADAEPALAKARIGQTVQGLNEVIRDIRAYIMGLRPQRFQGRSLAEGMDELARTFSANAGMTVDLAVDAKAAARATTHQAVELLHITQEALANIQKHANADLVHVTFVRTGGRLCLAIDDNGKGFDVFRAAASSQGHGLRNMQERVRALDGELEIESESSKGTRIMLSLPVAPRPIVNKPAAPEPAPAALVACVDTPTAHTPAENQ
jgi:signal transduction histidine kinase